MWFDPCRYSRKMLNSDSLIQVILPHTNSLLFWVFLSICLSLVSFHGFSEGRRGKRTCSAFYLEPNFWDRLFIGIIWMSATTLQDRDYYLHSTGEETRLREVKDIFPHSGRTSWEGSLKTIRENELGKRPKWKGSRLVTRGPEWVTLEQCKETTKESDFRSRKRRAFSWQSHMEEESTVSAGWHIMDWAPVLPKGQWRPQRGCDRRCTCSGHTPTWMETRRGFGGKGMEPRSQGGEGSSSRGLQGALQTQGQVRPG